MYKLLSPILILFIPFLVCNAQQYSFINYSVEDGLAQTQVFVLEAGSDGYLWIGTAGGVSRFDGGEFKNYSTENGLIDNTVKKIVYHNNYTWIASQYGITAVIGKKVTSWDLTSIAEGVGITSFTFDMDNNLWLAIRGKGVFKIPVINNKLKLESIQSFSLDKQNLVKTIFCDKQGLIWVGGKNTLGFFEHDVWRKESLSDVNYTITSFTENKKGEIIYATQNNGLFEVKSNYTSQIKLSENFGFINHLYTDKRDRLWISTNFGAFVLDSVSIKHFTGENGLINNRIKNITEDREGNIWLGTDGGGITRFTSDELVSYSKKDGLSSDYVLSAVEDDYSKIYFSTYGGGVSIFDGLNFSTINKENRLGDNTVWSSIRRPDSSLWFGTANGLSLIKNGKVETFRNTDWLTSNKILSLYNEKNKGTWVGTSKGVSFMANDGRTKVYKYQENFPAKNIRTIEKSLSNSIWVGTSSGVFEIKNDSVSEVYFNSRLENKIVYTLKKISNKIVLIGTGNGLYSFDGEELSKIKLHESFSANNINFIGVEDSNYVWVGTNYGIFEIHLPSYLANENDAIHHYSITNGLPSVETNLNSFYKDSKGVIWMGTSKGVVSFKRKHEKHESTNPVVVIDKVQLFLRETNWSKYAKEINEETKLPKNLSVGYKKNYFTFFYNAIAINQNKEIKYSVLLDGFDLEWSPPVKQSSVTYTNLPHGNYTFKVRATKDGVNWSKVEMFSFEIIKPYYLTSWFFMLIFILLFITVLIFLRWQVSISKRKALTQKLYYKSKLLALEQQTLNASMNRHFIFNSLNSIQYYINTKDRLSANKYLTNFAKLIRKNLDSSVSGTNLVPLSDELERLELYLSLENMRFKNKFTYEIIVEDNIDSNLIDVPPMFLQPYVENSIWHGILPVEKDGLIKVTLSKIASNDFLFVIEDNGIGIDASIANKSTNNHSSKGMSINSGRLEILKKTTNQEFIITGPFQIEDSDGQILGTRVEIRIKNN
jgi:ligand-binding sensor domain-containing protein